MKTFRHCSVAVLGVVSLLAAVAAHGQAATRYMGSVTAISGDKLTVKTAQGEDHQLQVPSTAEVKRIEPGETNLSTAVTIPFSELATGDRVLVWINPAATTGTPQALRIVAIKAADLAKKKQRDMAAWQAHGVGGLVKSMDPTSGTITITSGAGAAAKTVVVHTDNSTVLKRYAPKSESYDDAKPAPFSTIQEGDQLMARGAKDPASGDVKAEEIVSGSFMNISGLIASLDPATQTFVIKDLATKKQFTVEVPSDAQMRQVPANVAQMVAARLKSTAPAAPAAAPAQGASAGGATPQRDAAAPRRSEGGQPAANAGANGQRSGAWSQRSGSGAPSNDPQQMLARAPAIYFADLQKGEAVMLVASPGEPDVTAITLLAGVEALLEAPASQNLLANWSMGGGSSDSGDAAQ